MSKFIKIFPLNYRAIRALQICVVFSFTIFIQEFLSFPHAGWIGFSVMMIYVGFDHGTTLFRAYHRFLGMILGLLSGFFLWFIGHLDYRILILIIPVTIFLAYYLVGHAYSVPTIFTVNTAVIGTGYFSANATTTVNNFIYGYTFATIIAFIICVLFEYFWFRRYGLMKRFIQDTQNGILSLLKEMVVYINHGNVKRLVWFELCLDLNHRLNEANALVHNAEFEYSSEKVVGEKFNQFVELTTEIFIALKTLYSAYYTNRSHQHNYADLLNITEDNLKTLEQLIHQNDFFTLKSGVIINATK